MYLTSSSAPVYNILASVLLAPTGMMARGHLELFVFSSSRLRSPVITSPTVPSPPAMTMASVLSRAAALSLASPSYSV